MITVNCSQCKAALEMDDAFAGGVCRCHYCGTIQAVPANARRVQAAPAVTPGGNGAARHAPPRGDGLDALADAVASGSGRGALRSGPPPAPVVPVQPVDYARPTRKSPLVLILLALLGAVVLLLALGALLFVGRTVVSTPPATVVTPAPTPVPLPIPAPAPTPGTPPPPAAGGTGGTEPDAPPVIPKGPHFCDIKLDGVPSIVYVLDRGQATAELFDTLKEATYRSLESLKPGTKFQIVFWDNADPPAAYPADGLAAVSPQEIEAARAQFADVIAGGRAKADPAIDRAAKSEPAVIILVTGKAFDLEDGLVQTVQAAAKGKAKVHTVALRSDDGNPVLKQIADKTHGEFRVVSGKELREASY